MNYKNQNDVQAKCKLWVFVPEPAGTHLELAASHAPAGNQAATPNTGPTAQRNLRSEKNTSIFKKQKNNPRVSFSGSTFENLCIQKIKVLNSNLALPETGSGGLAFGRAAPTLPRGAAAGGLAWLGPPLPAFGAPTGSGGGIAPLPPLFGSFSFATATAGAAFAVVAGAALGPTTGGISDGLSTGTSTNSSAAWGGGGGGPVAFAGMTNGMGLTGPGVIGVGVSPSPPLSPLPLPFAMKCCHTNCSHPCCQVSFHHSGSSAGGSWGSRPTISLYSFWAQNTTGFSSKLWSQEIQLWNLNLTQHFCHALLVYTLLLFFEIYRLIQKNIYQ